VTARPAAVLLAVLAWVGPAAAQEPPQFAPPDTGGGILTGFTFRIGLESLSGHDSRFQWDFDLGGDVDLLRLARARVNLLVGYEAVMGEEIQHFDPIFNNYTIGLLGGVTAGRTELAVRFHHVSRHLGDRPKDFLVAWNEVGGQVTHHVARGATEAQVRAWLLGVVVRHFVDYTGEAGADLIARRRMSPKVAWVARGSVAAMFVDRDRFGRGTQVGGRAEAAVRFSGAAGAMEFYVALDRRIDPDPLLLGPVTWGLVGLRLVH
jgi:hypothetical protein